MTLTTGADKVAVEESVNSVNAQTSFSRTPTSLKWNWISWQRASLTNSAEGGRSQPVWPTTNKSKPRGGGGGGRIETAELTWTGRRATATSQRRQSASRPACLPATSAGPCETAGIPTASGSMLCSGTTAWRRGGWSTVRRSLCPKVTYHT